MRREAERDHSVGRRAAVRVRSHRSHDYMSHCGLAPFRHLAGLRTPLRNEPEGRRQHASDTSYSGCTLACTYSIQALTACGGLPLPHLVPLDNTSGVFHTPLHTPDNLYLSSLCLLYFAAMSDTDELTYDQGYYQGYKFAVFANLPAGIVYGEGQETRRHLSNF